MKATRIASVIPALGVFCLAVAVCVGYNLTVARRYFPLHDSLAYQTIAFHLLDEHCYCWIGDEVTVSHGPLWPFVIAGLSLIVGRADIFDRLFLCLVDGGTCVLIYLFARDLFGKRIGLIAGLVACVYPALYIYTGWLYTEALFTFLQTAVCYCVFRIQRNQGRDKRLWLLCAVLLALLALTHPNGILVVGLVFLWVVIVFWRKLLPKEVLPSAALCLVVALALVVPWTIRNYVVSHAFVPVASGSGTVLLGAYNDMALLIPADQGGWVGAAQSAPQVLKPFEGIPCPAPCEVKVENAETTAAIKWVESHLREMPLMMFYHLRNFFTPYTHEADMPLDRFSYLRSSKIVLAMAETFPIPVFLLAALGLVVTLRRYWSQLLFAYLVIGGTIAEILVFYGNARFRSPIEPLLLLLGAGALWWLTDSSPGTLRWWRNHRQTGPNRQAQLADPGEKVSQDISADRG